MDALPRRQRLSEHEFLRDHLIPRAPVVVTDEVTQWPAFHEWTWDRLVARFGDREVDLFDDWFVPTGSATLAEFVAGSIGVDTPDPKRAYVRWFARNGSGEGRWADDVFAALAKDWTPPSFLPTSRYVVPRVDPGDRASAATDPFPYRAIFLSARGARTRLHLDPWTSSAVLCHVVGTKRVRMYPPDQHALMLSISTDDGGDDRLAAVAPAFDDVLHRGEVLFVPAGWWHHVDTLTDSVSLTWNFVHASVADNLRAHVEDHPDDPELEVAAYFLTHPVGGAGDADVAALVDSAIAGSARAGRGGDGIGEALAAQDEHRAG